MVYSEALLGGRAGVLTGGLRKKAVIKVLRRDMYRRQSDPVRTQRS